MIHLVLLSCAVGFMDGFVTGMVFRAGNRWMQKHLQPVAYLACGLMWSCLVGFVVLRWVWLTIDLSVHQSGLQTLPVPQMITSMVVYGALVFYRGTLGPRRKPVQSSVKPLGILWERREPVGVG